MSGLVDHRAVGKAPLADRMAIDVAELDDRADLAMDQLEKILKRAAENWEGTEGSAAPPPKGRGMGGGGIPSPPRNYFPYYIADALRALNLNPTNSK